MKKKLFFIIFCILIFIYPMYALIQNWNAYTAPGYHARYAFLKKAYYSSQYTTKNHPGIIPDDIFESFAGGFFLTGANPILIVHDHPPLGRYFISLSILLFDNEETIPIILNIFSIIALYLISLLIVKNKFLALLPVGIFINQQLFISKFYTVPLGEPIQLPFILFTLYFFIKSIDSRKYFLWYILTSIFLGAVISIRFFILGAALASALVLYLLIRKKLKKIILLFVSFIFSIGVLLASYTQTFRAGYSLIKVLGIQKYILVYHKSALTNPFSFWDLLLFNRWHTWWGNYAISSDPQWSILWPISVFIIFVYLILSIRKHVKISDAEVVLLLWLGCYSMVLSIGYTSTRYFLPIVSILYILATGFVIKEKVFFEKNVGKLPKRKIIVKYIVSIPIWRNLVKSHLKQDR